MNLYDRLAPLYDDFFPQNPKATAFLLGLPGGIAGAGRAAADARPLAVDFGCATGSQVLDLAAAGWRAVGWEPSAAMLEIARRKSVERGLSADFEPWPMQEAAARIAPGSVDLALCLGNTLPHLDGRAELDRFIADLAQIAAPGGIIVFQLLNYERALTQIRGGEFSFPEIRAAGAAGAAFRRSYSLGPDGKLAFRVALEEDGRIYEGESRLRPFLRDEIASRLEAAGFGRIESRSGWSEASFDPAKDAYLILSARRP